MKKVKLLLAVLTTGALIMLTACPSSNEGSSEATPEPTQEAEVMETETVETEAAIDDAVEDIVEEGDIIDDAVEEAIEEVVAE